MSKFNNEEAQRLLKERGLSYACTELGNSERFVAHHEGSIKYVTELKRWVAWDSGRWKLTEPPIINAKETARSIYTESAECSTTQGRQELAKWAAQTESEGRINSMIRLSHNALGISVNNFDSDHETINCQNGVVNLRTAQLTNHSPVLNHMKQAKANYAVDAPCPLWENFLMEVFQGDQQMISYIQRVLGYCLTGNIDEHCMFIAYGLGSNGKTTLFETVLEILDDYGRTTEFSHFLAKDGQDTRKMEAVGMLRGVRLAVASETESTKKWNEALVKKLTGGDTLVGTKMYGDSYEFAPSFKLIFQVNHLPIVRDASHGFWRRVRVIPFNARFDRETRDNGLRAKLLQERDGIFTWLVAGARMYFENGLGDVPGAVLEATEDYKSENDILGRFISEKMVSEQGARIGVKEVHETYERWCLAGGVEPEPLRFFTSAMRERNVMSKRTSVGMIFPNWKLRQRDKDLNLESDVWKDRQNQIPAHERARLTERPPAIRGIVSGYDEVEALLKE